MANLLDKSYHTQETTGKLATRNRISIHVCPLPMSLSRAVSDYYFTVEPGLLTVQRKPTTECGARSEPRRELAQETKRPLIQPSLAKNSHFLRTGCFIT